MYPKEYSINLRWELKKFIPEVVAEDGSVSGISKLERVITYHEYDPDEIGYTSPVKLPQEYAEKFLALIDEINSMWKFEDELP